MNVQTLLTGWNFMRGLRLVLGVIFLMQAIEMRDMITGLIATFFLFQAVTNTGCCGSNGCAVPINKTNVNDIQDVAFEEVKTK
ncbi:MAG: hypothetical protein K9G64_06545 [Bacteroidia bacterium]|nr:hypothetical protein [Bacteroidia bacterium]